MACSAGEAQGVEVNSIQNLHRNVQENKNLLLHENLLFCLLGGGGGFNKRTRHKTRFSGQFLSTTYGLVSIQLFASICMPNLDSYLIFHVWNCFCIMTHHDQCEIHRQLLEMLVWPSPGHSGNISWMVESGTVLYTTTCTA